MILYLDHRYQLSLCRLAAFLGFPPQPYLGPDLDNYDQLLDFLLINP